MIPLTERKKEMLTGLFVPGLFLLGFGAGEGALQILQQASFGGRSVETSSLYYRDEETGLRLAVPGSRHGKALISSLGFRSPEIEIPKPAGRVRLAFLGSSTTFDGYTDEESNWPHLTARILGEAIAPCEVDYVNAGLPGSSTKHMKTHFEHHVASLDPDIVVILPGDVNADADDLAALKKSHIGLHYQPSGLAKHSILWSKIEKNLQIIRLQRAAHLSLGKLDFEPEELSRPFEKRLWELVRAVQAKAPLVAVATLSGQLRRDQTPKDQVHAANTALFYMPYMSINGLLEAREEYNRVVREVGRSAGVLVIDGHDDIPGDMIHYVDSIHFSAAGSRLMAQRVAGALLASKDVQFLVNTCASSE